MHEPPGPIDDDISAVLNFLYGRRGTPYSSLNPEEKRFLRDLLRPILEFSEKAAVLATSETARAVKIVQAVVEALPLYSYAFPQKRGVEWLFFTIFGRLQFSRPRPNRSGAKKHSGSENVWISPSGKLFVDLRQRLKQWGDENAEKPADKIVPFSFRGKGRPQACLAHSGPFIKFKSQMILCRFGCDAEFLRALKFKDILVKRILALDEKETFEKDRPVACASQCAPLAKSA
jgi:hypothetical protein